MQTLLSKHWHHLPPQEVVTLLDSDMEKGLDLFDIQARQERFGLNKLTPQGRKSPWLRFLLQFNNPLIYILLASSIITALIKDWVDALIIFGVVLVNAVIGYVQEDKAEKAIEALAEAMTTEATVVRAGKAVRISAADLVPGDIVLLKSGDRVPADLRLVQVRDLQVAEAALTGESLPVPKTAQEELDPDTVLADRRNMAYASTLVTYGQGKGVVTATGDYTEVGRISQLISSAQDLSTPLTRKMARFSKLVMYAILVLAAAAFAIGVARGQDVVDTLTAAIALAVAMIPEGLPAALTVTLAIGVSRMAKRRAIIRKLPAVETLGSTTIIGSDKTGTLTQNQMTVQQIVAAGDEFSVTGTGYTLDGSIAFLDSSVPGNDHPALREVLRAGLLCNDSSLQNGPQGVQIQGDPTEIGLLVSAAKWGVTVDEESARLPRLDAVPFESEHQYMATLHEDRTTGNGMIYVKGAVEVILEKSVWALSSGGRSETLLKDEVHNQAEQLASRGLRVLAFARKEVPAGQRVLGHEDIHDLTFLGLQAMIDPPRPEAIAAVEAVQNAGIQVKMITGDHALTAAAIARQIGLNGVDEGSGSLRVITGSEMSQLTDEGLIQAAERISVFARVSPEQKLRLVKALQARGHVVAMTGDGVNDGPALKQADIGIAMGITGTDVAKEAADIVLTDDNFATIRAAVEEGRGVFDNLTKIIAWTLPTNIGEGLVVLLALLLGIVLPILPIQILWINMTSVGVLGLVLALERKEPGIMSRTPRNSNQPILTPELIWRTLLVGILILIGSFGLFEWELLNGASLDQARTVAVNAVIMIGIFYLFNCRSLTQSMFSIGVFSNPWVIAGVGAMLVLQIAFTYVPWMNQILMSAPIGLDAWLRIVGMGLFTYFVIEFEKWLRRRFSNRHYRLEEKKLVQDPLAN